MSRRAVLWVAFVLVHIAVAVLGFVLPNEPMGDVHRVYEPWSLQALDGRGIVGITEAWVYPQLALVPMVLAHGFAWIAGYEVGWAILVTACDALAFAMLVGRGRSTGRRVGAWYWLAFIALLGPVGMYRLDGLTVPLTLAGSLWLVGRPWIGSALLAAATWIKVWPAAILLAAIIAVRRRLAVLGGAALVSLGVVLFVVAAGGGAHLFGFITDQADRGLQLEAPVSAVYLWQAVVGIPGSRVYYSPEMLTFQMTGPNVDAVIAVMTPLLAIAVVAVAGLGVYKAWRGAAFATLFPPLALGLVTAFIVFNKVGSPQYMTWIATPLVVGLLIDRHRWWMPASLGLTIALLTLVVYPLTYFAIAAVSPLPVPVLALTVRNALLVVLFAWMVARIARVRIHPQVAVRAARASVPTVDPVG